MANFTVGTISVDFGAMILGHQDLGGPIREFVCGTHFAAEADWELFRSLQNWLSELKPMPWGNTVEVILKGGPGVGTLTILGLAVPVHQAYLIEASRTGVLLNGHSTGTAKFWFIT